MKNNMSKKKLTDPDGSMEELITCAKSLAKEHFNLNVVMLSSSRRAAGTVI